MRSIATALVLMPSFESDDVPSAATLSSEYLRLAAPPKGLRFQSIQIFVIAHNRCKCTRQQLFSRGCQVDAIENGGTLKRLFAGTGSCTMTVARSLPV